MNSTITLPRSVVEQALEDLEMTINYVQSPIRREDMRDSIETLRAALEQPDVRIPTSVPDGWKLVPVEPTDEMVEAGDHEIEKWGVDASSSGAFRAMIAAAPQPPVVEQPQVEQETVGEAGSMPGTDGFTMACFRASDVPVGTKLYTRPQPCQPLTDAQINDHRLALPHDGEDLPDPWDFKQGVRAAERAHRIGGEA